MPCKSCCSLEILVVTLGSNFLNWSKPKCSGCFMLGVNDRRKSAGVINTWKAERINDLDFPYIEWSTYLGIYNWPVGSKVTKDLIWCGVRTYSVLVVNNFPVTKSDTFFGLLFGLLFPLIFFLFRFIWTRFTKKRKGFSVSHNVFQSPFQLIIKPPSKSPKLKIHQICLRQVFAF